MVRQQIKDRLFLLNRVAVAPSCLVARFRYRTPPPEGFALHLGCGPHYIPGMINADGNRFRKLDLWLDLRNRLPFPDRSAHLVWCSHTLEHLFPEDALRLLGEIRRVLRDDGVARIAVPCVETALKVARGEFKDSFPRHFDDPLAQMVNYLFVDGQHKYGYSFSLMQVFATQSGFGRVENYSDTSGCAPKSYGPPGKAVTVGDEPPGSMVVELRR